WQGLNLREGLESVATLMYYAALYSLNMTTRLLLDKGAEVNAQGGGYGNALQAASSRGGRTEHIDSSSLS
ncbi:uncharacterized protein M421DRAFT_78698, partial [Didymella exigua CBS 183.55]